ncbi:MAG TPA: LamG-like jellyroll fold domain-containing protein, partial [Bryobacteraceae bacterium]|nr:LamG-like jellyroll fold domain-containing protein [Bryobacteraceae bacterium]
RANGLTFDGKLDEVRVFNRALSQAEIQALPELAPTPLTFVTQPVSRVVAQFRPVTFTSAVRGAPPHFFQWFSNDVAIAGANSTSYTIPSVTLDMTGSAFTVNVSNFISSITSTNAILTVSDDTNAPALVSVGSVDGTSVGFCFSELMDPGTAVDAFNYEVTDSSGAAGISGIVLRPDGRTVLVSLSTPISGAFTGTVNFLKDLAGNEIAPGSAANGVVAGLTPADISAPGVAGSIFSCKDGEFDMIAGGDDIWDEVDQGYVALKAVSGDFDVKVRVQSLSPADDIAKAGLMVRETIDPGSPTMHLLANPPPPAGRGWIEAGRRTTVIGPTTSWGTNFTAAVMPNVWVRLRRTGDFFTGFYSVNGTDWVIMATASQVFGDPIFGDPVLVGLAATARDNATSTVAEFREFGDMQFNNPTLNITQQPASTSAPQNSTVTFNVQAAGTGAPASELAYEWQRDDGFGSFTNIPGANNASLALFARPHDTGAQFRVRVYLAGLVVDSDAATLTLTPDVTPPTIQSVAAPGQGGQVIVLFSEAVAFSAADTSKYAIVEAVTGTPVTLISATLGPDGRSVIINTPLLQENIVYRITVNDVQDLGEPANTIAPNSEAPFQYSSIVAYWQFEEGIGLTTTDVSGNGITGTLLNGTLWTPGLFGRYALEFDGTNDRVDAGNPAALNLEGSMTVAAWVYVESIADNGRIVTKGGGPGQRGWSLNVEGIDVWAFQIAVTASANISLNAPGIPIRRWTHVAGVYDTTGPEGEGAEMRLYTNGVLAGILRDGAVPGSQFNSPLNVSIGARPIDATFFDGKIDEVRIHARALNQNEIAQIARPRLLTATLSGGQIRLDWAGAGRLESTPALGASWSEITPQPLPPYLETLVPGQNRFYRLNATPNP